MPAKVVTITVLNARTLYEAIRTALAPMGDDVNVVFGPREPAKQTNQAKGGARAGRVCIYPGDEQGKAGEYGGATGQGHPKRIYNRWELVTIRVWGAAAPHSDDALQYQAAVDLEDAVLNALHNHASGRFEFQDSEWLITPVERAFGREKLIRISLQVAVLRTPVAAIPAHPAEHPGVTVTMQLAGGEETVCEHE